MRWGVVILGHFELMSMLVFVMGHHWQEENEKKIREWWRYEGFLHDG